MKKIIKIIIILMVVYVAIGIIFGVQTVTKKYEIESDKIDTQIDIIQISDFHSLKNYEQVLYITTNQKPDIIVLTGDIFTDSDSLDETVKFVEEIADVAPVYYINGNNDNPNGMYTKFKEEIEDLGVIILENESIDIEIDGQEIRIIGILDNARATLTSENKEKSEETTNTLNELIDESKYNIVLSHRPQYFEEYVKSGADLVLTGHTHGGMMRIPFLNKGLISPDQGFFAKYDYGIYEEENTTMIINSGTTTQYYIPRLYNPKEVVVIVIK